MAEEVIAIAKLFCRARREGDGCGFGCPVRTFGEVEPICPRCREDAHTAIEYHLMRGEKLPPPEVFWFDKDSGAWLCRGCKAPWQRGHYPGCKGAEAFNG